MNDAQSTITGLKAQDCPGGGWSGMPNERRGRATVADCLAHGNCGCIYGDAVQHIERLKAPRCDCDDECALSIENERLRVALEEIACEGNEWATLLARRALEGRS
jgi:hypothetical protein